MNFFLCSEDIQHILSRPDLLNVFSSRDLLQPYEQVIPRRNTALLGNDFLGATKCSITFDRVKFFIDPSTHSLEDCSWRMISLVAESIIGMRYFKTGSIDFQVLNSIEPNDILGFVEESESNPYDNEEEV